MYQKRINEYGITVGSLPRGQRNKITDVEGVQVGHCTIDNGENKTGVTVIIPGPGNLFTDKMPAAILSLPWSVVSRRAKKSPLCVKGGQHGAAMQGGL